MSKSLAVRAGRALCVALLGIKVDESTAKAQFLLINLALSFSQLHFKLQLTDSHLSNLALASGQVENAAAAIAQDVVVGIRIHGTLEVVGSPA